MQAVFLLVGVISTAHTVFLLVDKNAGSVPIGRRFSPAQTVFLLVDNRPVYPSGHSHFSTVKTGAETSPSLAWLENIVKTLTSY